MFCIALSNVNVHVINRLFAKNERMNEQNKERQNWKDEMMDGWMDGWTEKGKTRMILSEHMHLNSS